MGYPAFWVFGVRSFSLLRRNSSIALAAIRNSYAGCSCLVRWPRFVYLLNFYIHTLRPLPLFPPPPTPHPSVVRHIGLDYIASHFGRSMSICVHCFFFSTLFIVHNFVNRIQFASSCFFRTRTFLLLPPHVVSKEYIARCGTEQNQVLKHVRLFMNKKTTHQLLRSVCCNARLRCTVVEQITFLSFIVSQVQRQSNLLHLGLFYTLLYTSAIQK